MFKTSIIRSWSVFEILLNCFCALASTKTRCLGKSYLLLAKSFKEAKDSFLSFFAVSYSLIASTSSGVGSSQPISRSSTSLFKPSTFLFSCTSKLRISLSSASDVNYASPNLTARLHLLNNRAPTKRNKTETNMTFSYLIFISSFSLTIFTCPIFIKSNRLFFFLERGVLWGEL